MTEGPGGGVHDPKWRLPPFQEISNGRTHVSRTPKKPEYLIARSQLIYGSVGKVPFKFLMEPFSTFHEYMIYDSMMY